MLETKLGSELAVIPLNWQEAIVQIELLYPKLANIMENLNDSNQVFYKAIYRFGDTIVKSQIALLDEIRGLIEIYQSTIFTIKEHVKSLYDVANSVKLSYYHSSPENYRYIENASTIKDYDDRFLKEQTGVFSSNSQFFKGCIKIESKKL